MTERLARRISLYCEHKSYISPYKRKMLEYGIFHILSSILYVFLLVTAGLIFSVLSGSAAYAVFLLVEVVHRRRICLKTLRLSVQLAPSACARHSACLRNVPFAAHWEACRRPPRCFFPFLILPGKEVWSMKRAFNRVMVWASGAALGVAALSVFDTLCWTWMYPPYIASLLCETEE